VVLGVRHRTCSTSFLKKKKGVDLDLTTDVRGGGKEKNFSFLFARYTGLSVFEKSGTTTDHFSTIKSI